MYVIESVGTARRYVGQTQDLDRRLAEHNHRGHNPRKYTSRHAGPWRLVYSEKHPTRADACARCVEPLR